MTPGPELAELARRLEQVENALADAQARVPGLRAEVRAIGQSLTQLGGEAPSSYATAAASDPAGASS